MKNLFITLSFFSIVLFNCTDGDKDPTEPLEVTHITTVGAAHVSFDLGTSAFPASWNDTTRNPMSTIAIITCGAVEGLDVYHGGRSKADAIDIQPAYWKNGTKTILADSGNVVSIFALNGNVYTTGYIIENKMKIPVYWKNTTQTILDTIGVVNTWLIAAYGNDVYVVGHDDSVTVDNGETYGVHSVWKNGQRFFDMDRDDGINLSIEAIDVTNGVLTLAGNSMPGPYYWRNDTFSDLTKTSGAYNFSLKSIFVIDTDVYIAGVQTGASTSIPTYWKNGTPTILTDGTDAVKIKTSGTDVYVLGSKPNDFKTFNVPLYWKNGEQVLLKTPDDHVYVAFDFSIHI